MIGDTAMKRYNFFLPEDLVEDLKKIAHEKRMSLSQVIRMALHNHLVEAECRTLPKAS